MREWLLNDEKCQAHHYSSRTGIFSHFCGLASGRGRGKCLNVLNKIIGLMRELIHTNTHRPVSICYFKTGKLSGDIFYEFSSAEKISLLTGKAMKC
jgi:hypothetical protein